MLIGRLSRFVNVAGRKVNPGEVERVIAELPDVVQVWVMGVPNETKRSGPRRLRVAPKCRALGRFDPHALRGHAVSSQSAQAHRLC